MQIYSKMVLVKDYYWKHVKEENRKHFLQLMIDYDGSLSVYEAFYSIKLLDEKNKEAQEINYR